MWIRPFWPSFVIIFSWHCIVASDWDLQKFMSLSIVRFLSSLLFTLENTVSSRWTYIFLSVTLTMNSRNAFKVNFSRLVDVSFWVPVSKKFLIEVSSLLFQVRCVSNLFSLFHEFCNNSTTIVISMYFRYLSVWSKRSWILVIRSTERAICHRSPLLISVEVFYLA